jgi:RNA polymerase sigma-70 factor, ECF subfamily
MAQTQLRAKKEPLALSAGGWPGFGTIGAYRRVMTTFYGSRPKDSTMDPERVTAEQNLVLRCLRGDDFAWEEIVHGYARRIFNLCYRYTGRREEAEDLTQEIFIRIYQNLKTFRSATGSFQNWAMRLSRNLIIDRYRQARRSPQFEGSQELEEMNLEDLTKPSPQRRMEQAEASKLFAEALRTLSPENKEAIILRELHGMGYHEMAKVLRVPEGTVKSRINRGRLALARQLSRTPAMREMRTHLPVSGPLY